MHNSFPTSYIFFIQIFFVLFANDSKNMGFARKCYTFVSFRWLKRVGSCFAVLGLAVAIVILLLPGEHEQKNYSLKGNETTDQSDSR